LSVVIVNYGQWEATARLVRQVRAAAGTRRGDVEVVIVDNHSPRHRLLNRLRRLPEVSLRRWGRNRGFARAINEGCRLSRGEWFLLLNPDTTVEPDFVEGALALVGHLEKTDPRAGIVGFRLCNPDGSDQLSAGSFPTLASTLAGLALPRARRKYRAFPRHHPSRVPWVTGCAMLLRRSCLADLGGLDESYFLYYEDVDLCRRARARGWTVWYEPALRVIHHHPLHGRPVPAALRLATRHALLTYAARHWPAWQFRLLARIVRVEAWARSWRAQRRGDLQAREIFQDLAKVTTDVVHGDHGRARRRLERIMNEHAATNSGRRASERLSEWV
jgi:GT2 family glycosyltransferase